MGIQPQTWRAPRTPRGPDAPLPAMYASGYHGARQPRAEDIVADDAHLVYAMRAGVTVCDRRPMVNLQSMHASTGTIPPGSA
jgi:hypothetical protein